MSGDQARLWNEAQAELLKYNNAEWHVQVNPVEGTPTGNWQQEGTVDHMELVPGCDFCGYSLIEISVIGESYISFNIEGGGKLQLNFVTG